ncbi:hypothetical protein DYB32_007533 [Aphanomyces invadans]|uniref:Protein kinase domain-containing protein n=1 Tax=Aphanomyces invadans TaxID=157072 RepID=A0A3R6Z0B4_9STRA|nr:hypothetical protein DYB32_007533 [Aphanomyces invadans]
MTSNALIITLANNKIADVEAIVAPKLRFLYALLHGSSHGCSCPATVHRNLSNNQLPSLKGNDSSLFPTSLTTLDLSDNPLVELAHVLWPANLAELYLDRISTLQSVRHVDLTSLRLLSFQDTTIQNLLVSKDQFTQLTARINAKLLTVLTSEKTKLKTSGCGNPKTLQTSTSTLDICVEGAPDGSSNSTMYIVIGCIAAAVVAVVGFLIYRKCAQRSGAAKRSATPGVSFSVFVNQSARNHSHMMNNPVKSGAAGGRPRDPTLLGTAAGEQKYDVRFDPAMQQFRLDHRAIVLHGVLASGGFGVVHKATFKGETVAVKQLLPSIDGNSDAVTDFMEEIRLCSMLDHPHIVRFIGVTWTTLKDVSAVIEFMPKGDLANLVRSTNNSVKLVWSTGDDSNVASGTVSKLQILWDVVAGLEYLHGFHVIHRDLKAKNVLLGDQYEAKLSDFGTSRSTVGDATMTAEVCRRQRPQDLNSEQVGTIAWIAPEVLKGQKYSVSADMYSFGVLMSEVDMGISPYSHLVTNGGSQLPKPVIAMKVHHQHVLLAVL